MGLNSYTGHHKNVLEQVPCARGIRPKCSHCTLHHFLNHWEGAKDITELLVIHFTILKKKLCATMNLLPGKSRVSSVFGLTYSFADFTPSKKGDFSFTLVYLNCLSESEWDGLLWKVLDFIDWRLSLYTKSYLVTVAIVCCSDDFSWQSPSCNTFFGQRYLK